MSGLTNTLGFFDRCPICGVAKPLLQFKNKLPYYANTIEDTHWLAWYVYQCSKCGGPVSVQVTGPRQYVGDATKPHFAHVNPTLQFIPENQELSEVIPTQVRRFLSQAINSLFAPDGAAMLANSAVDATLKARGLKGGSVYKRLGEAVSQGLITNEMREWADDIRIESNNPRHADDASEPISVERAKLIVEFAKALADILFVLPAKAKAQANEAHELAAIG